MSDWERNYYGDAPGSHPPGSKIMPDVAPPEAADDDLDLPPHPVTSAPPPSRPKVKRPPLPIPRGTALYVIISVIFAICFGLYTGLFVRAFGDPAVHGIWVSIGSTLFVLWVIGVTTYAVLRISFVVSSVVLRAAAQFSILAFDVLRTPLKIATYVAIAALAVFGAFALYLRLTSGAS